jgi:hypothetical protein
MPPLKPDIEATDPDYSSSGKVSQDDIHYTEDANTPRIASVGRKASVAAKLRNPLTGLSEAEVIRDVDAWCVEKGLAEEQEVFRKGALIARVGQRDDGFEYVDQLSEEEKELLRHEMTHRWDHPFMLYFLVILCAGESSCIRGYSGQRLTWWDFRKRYCTGYGSDSR